jgi:hypothetical protein
MKLTPAENKQAFLKCGIQGFAGSGKTFTAAQIAVGLHKYIHSKKPVSMLDSETGSDYVLPIFKKEKIELLTAKSKAFIDLVGITQEAIKVSDILIVDSLTHFWDELRTSFQKKRNLENLTLRHWIPIKQEWRTFTDLFVNSPLHIIVCGRAGWEYDYQEDEEGVKELIKTGTRMKTEGEMAYEPSLLLEMEKVRTEQGKIGQPFVHRAWVLKDRCDVINGKSFDNPTFEQFLPHVKMLNIGGAHLGTDESRSSVDLFDGPSSKSREFKRRDIASEEIQNELMLRWPGQSSVEKKAKIEALKRHFNTGSWTAIGDMQADHLERGLKALRQECADAGTLPQEAKEEATHGAD